MKRLRLTKDLFLKHKEHLNFWTLESRVTGGVLKTGTYKECFDFGKEKK